MAIQFPSVGSTIFTTVAPTTPQALADGVANVLISAGWTKTTKFPSALAATLPGTLPNNGDTLTIATPGGGTTLFTYTFVTTLNNAIANQIKIAANSTQQAAWIVEAILAVSGGGTDWSTPTVASTFVTAASAVNIIVFTSIATGFDANSNFGISGSVGGWGGTGSSNRSRGRGYQMTCAVTPQGLSASLWIIDARNDSTFLDFWWGSADGTVQSVTLNIDRTIASGRWSSITITGGRTLQLLANAHQVFTWLTGDKATQGCQVGMCVPYLRTAQTPLAVTAATNASPIQITITAHGMTTGQQISLSGILGNTAANGTWTVTVVDANNVTLNGTTGNGTYSGGGLAGGPGGSTGLAGLSQCFFGWSDHQDSAGNGYNSTWRNALTAEQGFVCANSNSYGYAASNILQIIFPQPRRQGLYYDWGGFSNLSEPLVGWPGTAVGAQFLGMGQFWGAFVVCDSIPMDRTNTGFLGHNWINQTDFDGLGALWLATS